MLQRISIQNFKSLKDVTLDLQQVNLLIGPNNSGKTNLLKALEYLNKDAYSVVRNLTHIIPNNSQEIEQFKISEEQFQKYLQKYEKIIFRKAQNPKFSITLNLTNGNVFSCTADPIMQLTSLNSKNSSAPFFNFIIFRPDPNTFIAPQTLSENKILEDNCSNIATFLLSLFSDEREIFESLEQDFHVSIPDFKRISVVPENGKLFLRFTDTKGNKFGADEVSEGVLYFLALLCIVHQPNPPKLLLLEEPERGIHPRRIREVMDFIFRLAEEKDIQVIMTTHSTQVLDEFKDLPESVFIFDKDEEGATQIKNLLRDVIEPSNKANDERGLPPIKFTEGLGEHWQIGFLGGVPK